LVPVANVISQKKSLEEPPRHEMEIDSEDLGSPAPDPIRRPILDLNMEDSTQNVGGKRSAKRIDRGSEPPKTIQNNEHI